MSDNQERKKTLVLHIAIPGFYADDLYELASYYAEADNRESPTLEDILDVLLEEWMRPEVGLTLVSIPGEKCLNSDFEVNVFKGSIVGAELIDKGLSSLSRLRSITNNL